MKANNLMMFVHLAEGIDEDTWTYHLKKKDFTNWFRDHIHDDELVEVSKEAEKHHADPQKSKKMIIDFINQKYTA